MHRSEPATLVEHRGSWLVGHHCQELFCMRCRFFCKASAYRFHCNSSLLVSCTCNPAQPMHNSLNADDALFGDIDGVLTLFKSAPRSRADASDLDSANLALGYGEEDCTLRVSVVCRFHAVCLVVCKAVLSEGGSIACCIHQNPSSCDGCNEEEIMYIARYRAL